jgi:hypothetical protein
MEENKSKALRKVKRSDNLSATQQKALNQLINHGGTFIRKEGGFWTWPDGKGNVVPEWYCDVRTLRVLERKGFIILNEIKRTAQLVSQEP